MTFFKIFAAFLLAVMMAMQPASAADPAPMEKQEAGGFFSNMAGAVEEFSKDADKNLPDRLADAGYDIATAPQTVEAALTLAGGLALLYLLYEVTQFLSGHTRSMLQVVVDIGIPVGMAYLLIKNYEEQMLNFDGLLDIFRNLGAANPIESIMKMYGAVFGNIGAAMSTTLDNLTSWATAITDITKYMSYVLDALVVLVFCLIIVGLLLSGIAEVVGLLLLGPFLFAVGVAFGPLMIAGIVTPWTRDYFTKWLQYIVISAGLTGVINVVFGVAAELLKAISKTDFTSGEPAAVQLVVVTVVLLTINNMISQAPSIASSLFPGHVGASKSASGAFKQAMQPAKNVARDVKDTVQKGKDFKAAVQARMNKSTPPVASPAAPKAPSAPFPKLNN